MTLHRDTRRDTRPGIHRPLNGSKRLLAIELTDWMTDVERRMRSRFPKLFRYFCADFSYIFCTKMQQSKSLA